MVSDYLIKLLDEEIVKPANYEQPNHNPVQSAFISTSSGFVLNEMKSYQEWRAASVPVSWAGGDWDDIEDFYSYWPYLVNTAGSKPRKNKFNNPLRAIYAVVLAQEEYFVPKGLAIVSGDPYLGVAEFIEKSYPLSGLSRYTLALVPLEIFSVPDDILENILYFWYTELSGFDWSIPAYRMDTLVFWSSLYRDEMNKRLDHVPDLRIYTPVSYTPTITDVFYLRGTAFTHLTYFNPVNSDMMLYDIRGRVPGINNEASIKDIAHYFATGDMLSSISDDPQLFHELNGILCTYPDDVQKRLVSLAFSDVDPRRSKEIGAGFRYGRFPTRQGEEYLSYESIYQPRP